MTQPWEKDDCAELRARYTTFSIPKAAALWCKVPEDKVDFYVSQARQIGNSGLARCIWTHPLIPCLEARSRVIAEAMESGELPFGREDGRPLQPGDHAAPERRHVLGKNLKEWMKKAFPNDRPAFLFDEVERREQSAVSLEAYNVLKAEKEKFEVRFENAKADFKKLREEKEAIESQKNSLIKMLESKNEVGGRAESSYLNIIAALVEVISGAIPGVSKHPAFSSEASLIELLDQHYKGYGGLSQSNLSRKFPEAKRNLKSG